MQNSKLTRGMYALFILNFLTTILRIVWFLLAFTILFVFIVSVSTRTLDQLVTACSWLFSSGDPQGVRLLITCLVFLVLSIFVCIMWFFPPAWVTRHSKEESGKKYLLTWKKLREHRRAIIRVTWGMLQVIWTGLIVAVVIPVLIDLVEAKLGEVSNTWVAKFIDWISAPTLHQRLALSAIVTFSFISLILRTLARNLPKNESIVSVKELEPVYQSLEAVSKELQQLQEISQRILQHADEQFIKDLTEKIVEPIQRQLDYEKIARQDLEERVEQLKQDPNTSSVPNHPPVPINQEITQKLNRIPKK